ncbi:MAG: hypothetical protein ABWZ15_07070 [Acidimicrobiia bacterium]
MKKQYLLAAAIAAAVAGLTPSAAFAGEVTGNGKPTQGPAHSNSPCAFSGLDDQDPADGGSGVVQPGEVQNWGHTKGSPVVVSAPRGASDVMLNFGDGDFAWGCNGNLYGMKGATP